MMHGSSARVVNLKPIVIRIQERGGERLGFIAF
jgi:hypothetical protein